MAPPSRRRKSRCSRAGCTHGPEQRSTCRKSARATSQVPESSAFSQVPTVKRLQSSVCADAGTAARPRRAQSPCFGFEGAHQVRRAQRSPQAPWERPVSASRQRLVPLGQGLCLVGVVGADATRSAQARPRPRRPPLRLGSDAGVAQQAAAAGRGPRACVSPACVCRTAASGPAIPTGGSTHPRPPTGGSTHPRPDRRVAVCPLKLESRQSASAGSGASAASAAPPTRGPAPAFPATRRRVRPCRLGRPWSKPEAETAAAAGRQGGEARVRGRVTAAGARQTDATKRVRGGCGGG